MDRSLIIKGDVKLTIINDTSNNIIRTIDSLAETVIYALLFVMIVVLFFDQTFLILLPIYHNQTSTNIVSKKGNMLYEY